MNKVLKNSLIFLLAIVMMACIFVSGWFVYVYFFGVNKAASKTFAIRNLTLADGREKSFIEIQYFSNADNSGVEAFEIVYNNFVDEDRDAFYSQGIQYVGSPSWGVVLGESVLTYPDTTKFYKETGSWLAKNKYYRDYRSYTVSENITSMFNYQSYDDSGTWIASTNPLDYNSFFKINFSGEENVALMRFKGFNTPQNSETYLGRSYKSSGTYEYYYEHYIMYDPQFLSVLLYNSVKTLDYGFNNDVVFEFDNLFDYYHYNEDGQLEQITTETTIGNQIVDLDKIKYFVRSYYDIHITTYEYGLQRAQDSLFKCVCGDSSYNTTGNYASNEYFVGKTIIDCDVYSFERIGSGSNIVLSLSDDFIAYYEKFKNSIILNIEIDLDLLTSLGYNLEGVVESSLANFKVLRCVTISGDTIEEAVYV